MPDPIAVGIAEAAKLLGVSKRTVETLIFKKELPVRKIGRRTLIPYRDLQALIRRDIPVLTAMTPERLNAAGIQS